MKTGQLLHGQLSHVVARLAHGDSVVLADAGLPHPPGPEWIDLAVSPGVAGLLDVAAAVAAEMKVDRIVLATQLLESNPAVAAAIEACFPHARVEFVDHAALKTLSASAMAVVRTGEYTPYANVILFAGVPF
jgi:D-ribose pyranase